MKYDVLADIEESKDLKLLYRIKFFSIYYFFTLESEKKRKIAKRKKECNKKNVKNTGNKGVSVN